ncbi:ArnT family glycosyltransferase [Tropicimonas sp.]|uniref:ArnT family glycosyltransferase n=1 Tax=Tropicimonas sp. TaxID=2067044 RepID=UPI003A878DD6
MPLDDSNSKRPAGWFSEPPRRAFPVLATLIAAFLFLVLPEAVRPLETHSDEHYYVVGAARMLAGGDYVIPQTLAGEVRLKKPPMAYYYIVAGRTLFPLSPFATKFLWLVSAAGVLALTFAMARSVGATLTGAAVAVAALAGHRVFFRSATQHIPDMPLLLGVTLALAAFATLLSDRSGGRFWLYLAGYGGVAFAMLGKGLVALVVVAVFWAVRGVSRGADARPDGDLGREAAAFAIALLAAGWWFVLAAVQEPGTFRSDFLGDQVTEKVRFSLSLFLGNLRKTITDLWVPLLPVAVAVLLRRWNWSGWRRLERPILFLIVWAVAILCLFAFSSALYERYILPAIPAVAVLLGYAADRIAPQDLRVRFLRVLRLVAVFPLFVGLAALAVLVALHQSAAALLTLLSLAACLAAVLTCGRRWPVWAVAALVGMILPVTLAMISPLRYALAAPTNAEFVARVIGASGVPPDRVYLFASRKRAGDVGVYLPGVEDWVYPADLSSLPEAGSSAVVFTDKALTDDLAARGYEIGESRDFASGFSASDAWAAIRARDAAQLRRKHGEPVYVAIRR